MLTAILRFLSDHWGGLSTMATVPGTYFLTKWKLRRDLVASADRKSLQQLLAEGPSVDRVRHFCHDLDLMDSFKSDVIDMLAEAIDRMLNDPIRRFHSKKLQGKLRVVQRSSNDFRRLIGSKTFAVQGTDRQSVMRRKYGDAEDDTVTGHTLNELAEQVWVDYVTFLEFAKKMLVMPDDRAFEIR